tara:strand:+ start:873 stop:1568 length:696 start_codon:yes stop_codon:yes gene_type:complete
MLKIKNLHKSYPIGDTKLHVLKGINMSVENGEMVAIMGSSGSGKSTLLNIIGILDEADEGEYSLDNVKIKNLGEKKAAIYRNKFLGFIFQSFNLIKYKNALDNVSLPLYYQGLKREKRMERAKFYLKKVGLLDWSSHLPKELSGGQQQRVAIARALASEPKLILADEPTGALDSNTSRDIMTFLQKLNDEGKTILIVTHEQEIANMCKRIVRLRDGIILEDNLINQLRIKV